MYFEKKVDLRSRRGMTEFLVGHYRYSTMNSWNLSKSYANKIKIYNLGLTRDQTSAAYDVLPADGWWDEISYPIDEFTAEFGGEFTIGSNGRSGGYLVLYRSAHESTGYKSWCRTCGQRNYAKVFTIPAGDEGIVAAEVLRTNCTFRPEVYLGQSSIQNLKLPEDQKIGLVRKYLAELNGKNYTLGNKCGKCGAHGDNGRVNYEHEPRILRVMSGGMDEDKDYDEWSIGQLRDRVELVCRFDMACDDIRDNFIDLIDKCKVVEEVVMVPKNVRRLVCAAGVAA
jgi:hypothetical protein